MKILKGFMMAWGMFCSIPCPYKKWDEGCRKQMLLMLPFIGLIIGAIWYGCWELMELAHFHIALEAAVMVVIPLLLSGAIHADGFMDVCDAIFSHRDLQERQRILKDSHTGAFAIISLMICMLLMFGGMWSFLDMATPLIMSAVVMIPVMTRCASVICILQAEPLDLSQYYREDWHPDNKGTAAEVSIMFILFIIYAGISMLACHAITPLFFTAIPLFSFIIAYIAGVAARHDLRGMNGDISGFMITVGEAAGILIGGISSAWF